MKLIAGVFCLFVLTVSSFIACLSGLGVVLSFVASFEHADCMLGVFVWGSVFLFSAPISILSLVGTSICFSLKAPKITLVKLGEIATPDDLDPPPLPKPKIRLPFHLRAPNGWQTGLIISIGLFVLGLFWKFGN